MELIIFAILILVLITWLAFSPPADDGWMSQKDYAHFLNSIRYSNQHPNHPTKITKPSEYREEEVVEYIKPANGARCHHCDFQNRND